MKKGNVMEVEDSKNGADQVDVINYKSYLKTRWGALTSPHAV